MSRRRRRKNPELTYWQKVGIALGLGVLGFAIFRKGQDDDYVPAPPTFLPAMPTGQIQSRRRVTYENGISVVIGANNASQAWLDAYSVGDHDAGDNGGTQAYTVEMP